MSLAELFAKFPDDNMAEAWFVEQRWPDGVRCVFCGSDNVAVRASRRPQPYRCRSCRRDFSVKTNSLMHASKLGCRVWALAIYLMSTSLKGVSQLELHRDLGVTQKTAWYLAHRIRAAWESQPRQFVGPVETDTAWVGGKAKNMHASVRRQRVHGSNSHLVPVTGVRDRATGQAVQKAQRRVPRGQRVRSARCGGPTQHRVAFFQSVSGVTPFSGGGLCEADAVASGEASIRWPDGPRCPRCDSDSVQHPTTHPTMAYRCWPCHKFFSLRTGTVMQCSKLGCREWAIAIYLHNTGIKGTSSMKHHRDLGISQKSAWHLAHRIREAYDDHADRFEGPVEAYETYVGGKARNMHAIVRREKIRSPGLADKTPVVGIKHRATNQVAAQVVDRTDSATLQGFVHDHAADEAMVFTDDACAYVGLPHHASVSHSAGQYVDGMAHVNGMESFWAPLKRGLMGTYHHVSIKYLDRYVNEFCGRHNTRGLDTDAQMVKTARRMIGKHLPYDTLTA